MCTTNESDSECVATLVRVFRAACKSGDSRLRDAAIAELSRYGIVVFEVAENHLSREDNSRE